VNSRPQVSDLEIRATNYDTCLHIFKIQSYLSFVVQDMLKRMAEHDQSKLCSAESDYFAWYTSKLKEAAYGSDEYKEFLKALKPALDHHYANNSHHPEHYPNGVNGMNLFDVVEMLVDWVASSHRTKNGDVYRSIELQQERFGLDDQLKQILINTVDYMKAHGIQVVPVKEGLV